MAAINRRRFLQLAGGTAAASMLSASIARAARIPANRRTGTIRDVEHIVVLMQENRSFDHYLGTLRGVRGFGDPRPVKLANGQPVWYQSDGGTAVLPFHPTANDLGLQFLEDLAHDWNTTHQAWNNGAYDQWIPAKGSTTMAFLNRQDIPFHYALADAFTICDAYHCSLLTSTDPNRYYMWTGYTGNDGRGGGPVLDNAEAGYSWTTYPELLQNAGISWKVYQDIGTGLDAGGSWGWTNDAYIGNYGDTSLLYFDQYRNAASSSPLYQNARTGTNVSAGGTFFDVLRSDVSAGTLPQVSWIVAPEAFSEHPNWPANYGAWYVSQVLDALTADPAVWSKTALLITYDENDGFFDHVVPPVPPGSASKGDSTVDVSGELFPGNSDFVAGPYGLGPRVPMFVVSPWSTGGWVCSEVFDHTSIIRFIEQRFGVTEPNISDWRRAVCGDLTTAFDFTGTGSVPSLPSTASYVPPDDSRHQSYVPTPPTNPRMPRQEQGVRPARALPYDLAADATLAQGGDLRVTFVSRGATGAVYHVTSTTDTSGPWDYTVGAGHELTASWTVDGQSGYAFSVHGPNGFLREFAGAGATAGVDVSAQNSATGGQVLLTLTNNGNTSTVATVTDAYTSQPPATYSLAPGATLLHRAETGGASGWYDLSVLIQGDSAYRRRLAGHVETGEPSTSDPAFAAARSISHH